MQKPFQSLQHKGKSMNQINLDNQNEVLIRLKQKLPHKN